jgi:hypothetical protein
MSSSSNGGQGLVALLVMIIVLCFIVAYYCWGACCRAFCPRRANSLDLDPESQFSEFGGLGQPTIILLPYGRMVVVDSRVFSQLQTGSGLDLNEIGRQIPEVEGGTPDSEAKERLSPLSLPPPPTYDSIFGTDDMPPSYDDLLRRNLAVSESDCEEDLRESSV